MAVRPARPDDRDAVMAIMARLWPEDDDFPFDPDRLFIWEGAAGQLAGFASFSLRPYVDGCSSQPCPHVEGWWVEPGDRGRGIGRALIAAIEDWAIAHGFQELSSDTQIWNRTSQAAHVRLGFEPTEQLQYFRKPLGPQ